MPRHPLRRATPKLCVAFTLSLWMLTVGGPVPAHAQQRAPLSAETLGHAQVGVAIFDRQGVLADETSARGVAPLGGPTLRVGFVRYIESFPHVGFGGGVRGTFGNSESGNREYYFNPIFTSATLAARYPLGPQGSGLNLALDLGFTNILAKSRVLRADRVDIFHEYGIGPGVGALIGYRLALPSWGTALTASLLYSRHWVGVEIDGGSSKQWALGTSVLMAGLEW